MDVAEFVRYPTNSKSFADLEDTIDLDQVSCGVEHPKLHGNCCVVYGNHDVHEDLAGNEWQGKPYD